MAKMTMVVDLDKCVGCYACEIACKQENDVALSSYWNMVHEMGPQGEFPNLKMYWLPRACQQCMNPSCVEVCPTGASYVREDGRVLVDAEACIGCGSCVKGCPYGARSTDGRTNVAGKCNLCADLCDEGGLPACVKCCVNTARIYGDMTDPESDVSRALAEAGDESIYALPDTGNGPTVKYILHDKTAAWEEVEL